MCAYNSYIPPGYIPERSITEFLYSPSAGSLSMRAVKEDGTYVGDEGDKFRELQLCARGLLGSHFPAPAHPPPRCCYESTPPDGCAAGVTLQI